MDGVKELQDLLNQLNITLMKDQKETDVKIIMNVMGLELVHLLDFVKELQDLQFLLLVNQPLTCLIKDQKEIDVQTVTNAMD